MAIKTTDIGTSALWEQWRARHNPPTIRLLPATSENMHMDTHPTDPDTREEWDADRRAWNECAPEYLDTSAVAEREAHWIERYEADQKPIYRKRLQNAGYEIP